MSGRSWMAALTLAASLGGASLADDHPATAPPPASPPAAVAAPGNTQPRCVVKLELAVAGLTSKGCDVEVKPAHAGCKFTLPPVKHLERSGKGIIQIDDVTTESADRDCSFAITIREPGQPPRTLYRGFRLNPPSGTAQLLSCFTSAPSRGARIASESKGGSTTTKR